MWPKLHRWKNVVFWPVVALASVALHGRELSPSWYAGLFVVLLLGLLYVAEEIVWMTRGRGRPCGHCGKEMPMKSFRVQITCPHCGLALDGE